MKNFFKLYILFIVLIVNINILFAESYTTCDATFNNPTVLYDDDGSEMLSYVISGNILFSEDFSNINFGTSSNDVYNNVNDRLSSIPSSKGLLFKSSSGNKMILFGDDKTVYTKGYAVYKNAQAGCSDDGWRNDLNNPNNNLPNGWYCNSDGITREQRDYYCLITTNPKAGTCEYNILETEDCSQRDSVKYVVDYTKKDSLRDYLECKESGSNVEDGCSYQETDYDYCYNSNILHELIGGSPGIDYTSYDCRKYNYHFCEGSGDLDWTEKIYYCNNGACKISYDKFIQRCPSQDTNYGVWGCGDSRDKKVRTNIEYIPKCSVSGCSIGSSNVKEYDSCSGATHCSSGKCVTDTYSWYTGSFNTCSATCDGGTQTRDVECRRDDDNKLMSDGYCSGTKPDTSQDCNTHSCAPPPPSDKYTFIKVSGHPDLEDSTVSIKNHCADSFLIYAPDSKFENAYYGMPECVATQGDFSCPLNKDYAVSYNGMDGVYRCVVKD